MDVGTSIFQDLRYAFRMLLRSPLIAGAVVLTLALGIGVNTGVFTVVDGMLFRARVGKDPGSFVHFSPQYSGDSGFGFMSSAVSFEDYTAFRDHTQSIRDLATWSIVRPAIGDDTSSSLAMLVSEGFFNLYGLERPKLGRLFLANEFSRESPAPVVVISEELWRSRFAADPDILGKNIKLNRRPFVVIGVTPARFSGILRGPGIWMPDTMHSLFFQGQDLFRDSTVRWLIVEGRLKPGCTRETAQSELSVIARQQDQLHPGRKTTLYLTNGSSIQEPSLRANLIWIAPVIMGALTLVLLLACTNVTMLLLARASARQREIAIRVSLGAGRGRLLRMLLTESLFLAATAGAISAYVAYRVPDVVQTLLVNAPTYPLKPDLAVFTYLAAITLLAGLISGLTPAAESLKVDISASLKGHTQLFGARNTKHSTRGVLISAQAATSLVLLIGAGLFIRAQYTLFTATPGFEMRQVLLVPMQSGLSEAFYRNLEQRVRTIPGVQSVSFTSSPPLFTDESGADTEEARLPGQAKKAGVIAGVTTVSAGYFDTMRIPIVLGRAFQASEASANATAPVVIVSEAFAKTFWPGENPVGKSIEGSKNDLLDVIGVARDTQSERFGSVDGPHFYRLRSYHSAGGPMLVRFAGDAASVERSVKTVVRDMDREMLVTPQTLEALSEILSSRFGVLVKPVAVLGITALLLAIVGIYGVVAFAVAQRTREFGIRMALGASQGRIMLTVLRSGIRPIALGFAGGLTLAFAGSYGLRQAFRGTNFAFNARDPIAYAAVVAILGIVALAAMCGPALRAARSDPMQTLRQD
ncbi:MAG TPA: ABC transporter permease [Bryobacteraceae bacterium]|nr:ABC transporter permease [Bryobacteraceae bacterium]